MDEAKAGERARDLAREVGWTVRKREEFKVLDAVGKVIVRGTGITCYRRVHEECERRGVRLQPWPRRGAALTTIPPS